MDSENILEVETTRLDNDFYGGKEGEEDIKDGF